MEDVKVNVMMFGGRRCGKTSIIAAMKSCFDKVFGQDLVIFSSDETAPILEDKINEINDLFNMRGKSRTIFPDSNPTLNDNEFGIGIRLKNKTSEINLNFIDYPGEKIRDDRAAVGNYMKKSQIIMIAIDTPFLMEQTNNGKIDSIGIYNERRNFCQAIAEMIKKYFKKDENEKKSLPTMVMFIPIKCEKYYNAGQMDLVNQKIHIAYKSVFDYVDGINKSNFEVVISPILTFGKNGIEFSRFETDENGDIVILNGIPKMPLYIFTDKNKENNGYNPEYCEQPILYSLAYLLSVAEKAKEKEWFSFFRELFGAASLNDFMEQKKNIIAHLKTTGDGFEIFSDPLKFRRS